MKARGLVSAAGFSVFVLSGCGGGGGMMTSGSMPMPASNPPTSTMPGDPMNPGGPMNPMPMNPMSVPGEAAIGAFLQTRHDSLLRGVGDATALAVNAPA